MTIRALLLVPAFALVAIGAAAQPVPLGSEFQVNSHSSDSQQAPAAAMDGQGGFVMVWDSQYQDGSGAGVFARRFNSAGVAQGAEFQVNSYTTESQADPDVGRRDNGDFVVVWRSTDQDGSEGGIFARRFASSGLAQGAELQVNSYTSSQQVDPVVAVGNGGFVVVWGSYQQDGSHFGVYGKRFDAGGVAQGAEFRVNTYTSEDQFPFDVALDAAGGFVVTWGSYDQDGPGYGVFARRFASGGTPIGGELQVNTYTPGGQNRSTLAIAGSGEFVVAWLSYPLDASSYSIVAQRFDSAGIPQGGELQVSMGTSNMSGPVAGMDNDGDFLVAWSTNGGDGSSDGVLARHFHASGIPQGAEFQINTYTPDDQHRPDVAMAGNGRFVVLWESDTQDGSGYGVFARRFAAAITLDVDGDGSFQALTDGLLLLRYAFGFRGATLISGVVGPGCTRCLAPDIEAYIGRLD